MDRFSLKKGKYFVAFDPAYGDDEAAYNIFERQEDDSMKAVAHGSHKDTDECKKLLADDFLKVTGDEL